MSIKLSESGDNVQTTTANNSWDDIEVSESTSSFGEESRVEVTKTDDKPVVSEPSTEKKEVIDPKTDPKDSKEKDKRNYGSEKRIKELWQQKTDAEKREAALIKELEDLKKKSMEKVTKDNFDTEDEYLDWKMEQKFKLRQTTEDLRQVQDTKTNATNEEFKLSWNDRISDNYKTPEEVKTFGDLIEKNVTVLQSIRPEIHQFVQHSQNGPIVLEAILSYEDLRWELTRMPKEIVFSKLNNLEANLIAQKSQQVKKVSKAPGPLGIIDNKIDIVSSPDNLPEDQFYDNYLKRSKKKR